MQCTHDGRNKYNMKADRVYDWRVFLFCFGVVWGVWKAQHIIFTAVLTSTFDSIDLHVTQCMLNNSHCLNNTTRTSVKNLVQTIPKVKIKTYKVEGLPNSTGKITSLFTFKMHAVDQAVNHLKRMQFLIRANDTGPFTSILLYIGHKQTSLFMLQSPFQSAFPEQTYHHFVSHAFLLSSCYVWSIQPTEMEHLFFSSYKSQQWTTPFTQSTSSEILTLYDPGMWSYNQNFISSFLDAYIHVCAWAQFSYNCFNCLFFKLYHSNNILAAFTL